VRLIFCDRKQKIFDVNTELTAKGLLKEYLEFNRLFFINFPIIFKSKPMSDWAELQQTLIRFRDERDWAQFHNAKDLALALSIEASELNELFLWKNADEANKEKIKDELADVIGYALLIAEKYNLDVNEIVLEKIRKNGEKYPVDKAKGTAKKYNEL